MTAGSPPAAAAAAAAAASCSLAGSLLCGRGLAGVDVLAGGSGVAAVLGAESSWMCALISPAIRACGRWQHAEQAACGA